MAARGDLRPPAPARRLADRLRDKRDEKVTRSRLMAAKFDELQTYLAIADQVSMALEQLSEQLFQQILAVVQEKLTIALQEILEQPITLRATASFLRGAAAVEFSIERDGQAEDVLRGQGGSVANVLSVGLRMFALTTLDQQQHRGFLVLDEQDCWLRPELVPRLVKVVREASDALGFQVLMISHHDFAVFERYAERIYEFVPQADGSVDVVLRSSSSGEPDPD